MVWFALFFGPFMMIEQESWSTPRMLRYKVLVIAICVVLGLIIICRCVGRPKKQIDIVCAVYSAINLAMMLWLYHQNTFEMYRNFPVMTFVRAAAIAALPSWAVWYQLRFGEKMLQQEIATKETDNHSR